MPATGTYPALQVDAAFGVAASAVPTAGQWQTISTRVAEFDVRWGKDDEFAQPGAGTMSVVMDNADGVLDPDNTSSPHYGNLKPLTWVRLKGGTTTASNDVFYGLVSLDGWQVQFMEPEDSTVRIDVVDMTEYLSAVQLPSSVWTLEVTADAPNAWYRLGESSGTVATDSSGNGYHGNYEGGATFDSRSGLVENDADNAIEFSGDNRLFIPAAATPALPFTVEFVLESEGASGGTWELMRLHSHASSAYAVIRTTATTIGVTSSTGTGTGQHFWDSTVTPWDGQPHVIAITFNGSSTKIHIDGVDRTGSDTGFGAHATPLAGTWVVGTIAESGAPTGSVVLDELAFYTGALSLSRIIAHHAAATTPWASQNTGVRVTRILDAAGVPTALWNVENGNTTMQSADLATDAKSALDETANAEFAPLYIDHQDGGKVLFKRRRARWEATTSNTSQATFGDGGGSEVPYSRGLTPVNDRLINSAGIQRSGGATVLYENATSKTAFGTRSHSESGLLYETDAESQYRAEYWVNRKSTERRMVRSVVLEPRATTHPAWAQVFTRRMGDRVTVKKTPHYTSAYTYEATIIGIKHRWSQRAAAWRTEFSLEPAPDQAFMWGGTAAQGWGAGVWAF